MNIKDITDAMDGLVAAMVEKGVVDPRAQMTITETGRLSVHIGAQYGTKPFDGEEYQVFFGDDCIPKATAYIAAMPAPETVHIHAYMRKLADAVDYGHSNGVPDEYVDPARVAMKAMSDNLLEVEK